MILQSFCFANFYEYTISEILSAVDYAKARCEKKKLFEERFFPSPVLPFPILSSRINSIGRPIGSIHAWKIRHKNWANACCCRILNLTATKSHSAHLSICRTVDCVPSIRYSLFPCPIIGSMADCRFHHRQENAIFVFEIVNIHHCDRDKQGRKLPFPLQIQF